MTRFRDFDAARAERVADPIEFVIGGERFTSTGELPAGVLLDIGRAIAAGNDFASFALFTEFFDSIVAPADHERFAGVVRSTDIETVLELAGWIIEEATGRPLSSVSSSEAGPSRNGVAWKPDAPSPELTPSP